MQRAHYDDLEFDDDLALLNGAPFTGVVYAIHEDGKPEIEFNYIDGLPSGLQRRWFRSGQLEQEWDAVRGQGSAWSRTFYLNGVMQQERINEDNLPVRIREWSADGSLLRDTTFERRDPPN